MEKVLLPDYKEYVKVNLALDLKMVKEYILGMKIVFTQERKRAYQHSFGILNYTEDGLNKTLSGYWYDGKLEVLSI